MHSMIIKRYSEEENLKDKSSKPKNSSHKLGKEEMQKIINKAHEDREKIKLCNLLLKQI
ncbi:Uncharacterised protein [uncultured archaeon]|nr:Uncharacterised protein [uncultured archaeon]